MTETDPLWREAVGAELRRRRREADRTLADVAQRSGISVAYLSEIERGRKDPSSEMLAAVAGALGLGLVDLTCAVTETLGGPRRIVAVPTGVSRRGSGPLLLAA